MKIVSLTYMHLSTHKIWVVGMLIYILCTSIGICCNNDFKSSPPLTYNTTFLNPGGGIDGPNDTVPVRSQFSSSFELEEDDDDSDRSLFAAFPSAGCQAQINAEHLSAEYQAIGIDIITPPPRIV